MTPNEQVHVFVRLLVATVLGFLIGAERGREGKPAGVRTHGLVSLGSAVFTVVSIMGFGGTGDPARVAAQIVAGVGFLCAGVILHDRGGVYGLTTAASLWVSAAIGTAAGTGMMLLSAFAALLAFLVLRFGPRQRVKPEGPPEK
jgi:putative Mg2+ transporter-C (MgtC) family protein